jgi:hypothetical protein
LPDSGCYLSCSQFLRLRRKNKVEVYLVLSQI